MEQNTVMEVTPESGQDEKAISFDENGELQLSEAGLEGFKELLKDSVTNNTERPTEEETPEKEEAEEAEEKAIPEKKEAPAETPKRKLKVDGQEIEVTEDELVTLAQQGKDYTKKTQQLADERNALAPYEALIKQLKTDPNLSQHIAKYWQPQQSQEPAKPTFDDPIEQLKWETKQEAIAEFRKELAPLQQQQVMNARQQGLNQVRAQVQADPDYKEVHQAILDMVKSLPPAIQKNAFLQLDQDPASYLEAFQKEKLRIAANKKAAPEKTTTEKTTETKRTERAPILETSGNAPSEESIKSHAVKISKAKAKAMREGGIDALQEFLEVGGFLDHLK
jgi:hypothetical protein